MSVWQFKFQKHQPISKNASIMRANFLQIYQDFRLGWFKFLRAIDWSLGKKNAFLILIDGGGGIILRLLIWYWCQLIWLFCLMSSCDKEKPSDREIRTTVQIFMQITNEDLFAITNRTFITTYSIRRITIINKIYSILLCIKKFF